jgi:uncharacterized cupredoxin-like copper-binding protein
MPAIIDKDQTEAPPEERFVEDVAAPPKRTRTGAIALAGALLVALLIAIGFVVATGGDTTSDAPAPVKAPAPAAAKPAAPAAAAKIGVALRDFTVTPAPTAGLAGKVTFRVHNAGAVKHEFVVIRTNKPAADLLKGSEANEAGNVGEIGDLQPGATKSLRLDLKAGHYALICNLPGHYAAGQRADFVVK